MQQIRSPVNGIRTTNTSSNIPTASTTNSLPPEYLIDELVFMGFPKTQSISALQYSRNNVEEAIEYCLQQNRIVEQQTKIPEMLLTIYQAQPGHPLVI